MGRRCAPGCVFREDMPPQVDLYDSAYSHYEADVYRQVRMATYGEDLGQTSWVTNAESREIPRMLGLSAGSYAFEVGCGSGRYALQVAETVGCRVLGVDVNEEGVRNGNALARAQGLSERVRFECCDASKTLPYEDNSFDAAFANDVMCHVPGRPEVLREVCVQRCPGNWRAGDESGAGYAQFDRVLPLRSAEVQRGVGGGGGASSA
jgi:SAM-dependent methyltransferase